MQFIKRYSVDLKSLRVLLLLQAKVQTLMRRKHNIFLKSLVVLVQLI